MSTPTDRDLYADHLLAFRDWCERHERSFPLEMTALIRARMGNARLSPIDRPARATAVCADTSEAPHGRKRNGKPYRTPEKHRAYMRAYFARRRDANVIPSPQGGSNVT